MAIGSLICGILGCIPVITSLLAVILGILGIKKSKQPNTGGKGLAIAGIILGIIGIIGWGVAIPGMIFVGKMAREVIDAPERITREFVATIQSGDGQAARQFTPGLSDTEFELLRGKFQKHGSFQKVQSFNIVQPQGNSQQNQEMRIGFDAVLLFTNGTANFSGAAVVNPMDPAKSRIENLDLSDPPGN
jgi:hypothetical protein